MLMAASRNQAEDVEKNEITAMEERKSVILIGTMITMLRSFSFDSRYGRSARWLRNCWQHHSCSLSS